MMDIADTNGTPPEASADDQIVTQLRADIARRRLLVDELRAQIAELEPDLKRRERALALLTGESSAGGPLPGVKRGPYKPKGKARADGEPAGMGEERLATIREKIIEYARNHEEFTQTDIRARCEGPLASTSVMATGFEKLRQRDVIRFARMEGNRKVYRLTAEALREVSTA